MDGFLEKTIYPSSLSSSSSINSINSILVDTEKESNQKIEPNESNEIISNTVKCNTCKSIPLIESLFIDEKEELILQSKCQCGQKSQKRKLDDILEEMENSNCHTLELSKCICVNDNPCLFYCEDCHLKFCKKCKESHSNHKVLNYEDELKNLSKIDVENKIKGCKDYIDNDCLKFKESYIKKLRKKQEIIEEEYKNFKNRNGLIIKLIKILYNQSSFLDYNYIINKKNFSSFHLEHFNEKFGDLLTYFKEKIINSDCLNEVILRNLEKINLISAHDNSIYKLIKLSNGNIASCSSDKTIKIFDSIKYGLIKTLNGHSDIVHYIAEIPNNKLVSVSNDSSLIIWNLLDYSKETITKAHNYKINSIIYLPENRIVTCSVDSSIKIWSTIKPIKLIHQLKYHNNKPVISIIYLLNKNRLVAGSHYDKSITFWDVSKNNNKFEEIKLINDIPSCCWMNSFLEYKNYLLVGERNTIRIIDLNNNYSQTTITHDFGLTLCFCIMRDSTIVFGSEKGSIGLINKNLSFDGLNVKNLFDLDKCDIQNIVKIDDKRIAICYNGNNIYIYTC